MRYIIVCITAILFVSTAGAQGNINAKKIKNTEVPRALAYKGKLKEAWTWTDALGRNYLLLSVTAPVFTGKPGDGGTTQELFAYDYIVKDTARRLLWKLADGIHECELDHEAVFIGNSTRVTDLDGDGIAETTVQYKLACRGDYSPADMKLIMHEDSTKYALRGSMWIPADSQDTLAIVPLTVDSLDLQKLGGYDAVKDEYSKVFGRYENEKGFEKAPPPFLDFARKQWLRFVKETFE